MAAWARSAAILCPARPRDGGLGRSAAVLCPACPEGGGLGTFSGRSVPQTSGGYACPGPINPPSRHRSVPCPPGGWWPRHVLRALCALPARRMAAQARSAVILFPACLEYGGLGTFSGYSVPWAFSATFRWAEESGRACCRIIPSENWRECCRITPAQFQGRDVSVWVG